MASSGATAWAKYFKGKSEFTTKMKKDSTMYDIDGKRLGVIPAGTEIIYMGEKTYDSKPIVKAKKNNKFVMIRVAFDSIAKPGVKASGAVSLKPQAFGVVDTIKYSPEAYYKLIKEQISERKDLNPDLRVYLDALLDNTCKKIPDSRLSAIYKKVSSDLPINDIKKDFGEVLGPLAIKHRKILEPKGIKISPSMRIEVPLRPNEPLMDYAVYNGTKKYVISAKSGETTNVVKPNDIIDLLKKDPKKIKKWSNTKEYGVLSMLAENSILFGPIKAVSYLKPKLISKEAVSEEKSFNATKVAKFINDNDYLSTKKSPTTNEIMYECEKEIQNASKRGELDINAIFSDAIENMVIYVKFDISSSGVSEWDVVVSSDIKKVAAKRAFLRTKNGYTRASDRMGVQI